MPTIIYVDDEFARESAQSKLEMLSTRGYHVIPVPDVRDAVPTIKKNIGHVNAILLDIMMPPEDEYTLQSTEDGTLTGLLLLRDIRTAYPTLPVVIVSVKLEAECAEYLKGIEVSAFITKPTLPSIIADTLDSVLGGTR